MRFVIFRGPYYPFAARLCRIINRYDTDGYNAPLNPLKLVWVDPSTIQYKSYRDRTVTPPQFAWGSVKSGEWDKRQPPERDGEEGSLELQSTRSFDDHIIYRSFEQHFEDGAPWPETDIYRYTSDRIERGDSYWHGCSTLAELERRCEFCDELYQTIKSRGYKSQQNLRYRGLRPTLREEIVVDIGRDGELLHIHSKHRLALAKILNIDRIPVAIATRHSRWMEFREEVYENDLDMTHPDFEELGRSSLTARPRTVSSE